MDKILKGAKSGDISFEQPKKFDLIVNLKVAKQNALTNPSSVLAQEEIRTATHRIEMISPSITWSAGSHGSTGSELPTFSWWRTAFIAGNSDGSNKMSEELLVPYRSPQQ